MSIYIREVDGRVHEFPDSFAGPLDARCTSSVDGVRYATDAEIAAFLAERENVYQMPLR